MKIRLICLLFSAVYAAYCINSAFAYEEMSTSYGKVITGLTREESLDKFGAPVSASDDLWLYGAPEKFFVYFSGPSPVYLYPKFCSTSAGIPLELKAFTYSSGFKIKDISREIELLPSEPRDFTLGPGKKSVIIPKKAGEYQILGKYGRIFSNPVYITVREAQDSEQEKERLLAIDILPYRPKATPRNRITFMALGTFYNPEKNKYAVRDISEPAEWFLGSAQSFQRVHGNKIFFDSAGKFKVFCRYKGLQSFSQDVEINDRLPPLGHALKHITLLPEFVIMPSGGSVDFKGFGTCHNNRIDDVTLTADWDISDKEVLKPRWKGSFQAKSEGVTEATIKLDKIVSLPAKVIITAKQEGIAGLYEPKAAKDKRESPREDIESLKRSILSPGKRLKDIKITPEYLAIPAGMEGEFTARGVYSDGSETDLTKIGKWTSSDDKIAKVILGKTSALSVGESDIYIEFQGVRSSPARVSVEGAKLVSIIISPRNSKISMLDKIKFKAEGYFSDSLRKDITSSVSWNILGPRIVKIKAGAVQPLKFGHTSIFAEYRNIKSLPADITVIFTMEWLVYVIFKAMVLAILAVAAAFFILYILVLKERRRLLSLQRDKPGEFIIELYGNFKKILAIFGLGHKEPIAPLLYAQLIEKKLGIGNRLFLSLTEKFEEALSLIHI